MKTKLVLWGALALALLFVGTVFAQKAPLYPQGIGCYLIGQGIELSKQTPELFIRGDYDGDGDNKEMSDYLSALAWIFKQPGYVNPQCLDAVDYDNDGNALEMSDQLSGLNWAFSQPGSVPPAGYVAPGICYSDPASPSDTLDCQCHPYCMGCKGKGKK